MAGILRRELDYEIYAVNVYYLLFEGHLQLEVFALLRFLQDIQASFSILSVFINSTLNLFRRRVMQEIGGKFLGLGRDFGVFFHVRIFSELDSVVVIVVHVFGCGNVVERIGFGPKVHMLALRI
jgi:hypothetical protein